MLLTGWRKSNPSRIVIRLFLLSIVTLVWWGCSAEKKPASPKGGPNPAAPPRKVQIAKVGEQRLERTITALGSLLAYEQAVLSAKVPGRLQSIAVDLGSSVRTGAVLAQIEARDYELKVQQAAAALAQVRVSLGLPLASEGDEIEPENIATVKEARAVLDEAKANLGRLTQLWESKITARSEVDTAQSTYLVALNRYQNAKETVREQQALIVQRRVEYEIARQQLADTTLVAPFDGGIQERRANLGEYLTVGSPVVSLVRLDPLRLRVEVSEREAPKVALGQSLRFSLEGDSNVFTGRVQRLSPALNEGTRMLVVEADIRNDGRLRSGYFVRAEIVTAAEASALTVPTNAVITFAGVEKVFTCEKTKAVEKRVTLGRRAQNCVEVISGLKGNDEVILEPGNLQTGHPVIIAEPVAH